MPEIVKTTLRKTKLTDNILEPLVNGDMSKMPSDLVGEHQIFGIVPCTAGGLRPVLLLFTLTIFSNISPAPKPETTWTLLNI